MICNQESSLHHGEGTVTFVGGNSRVPSQSERTSRSSHHNWPAYTEKDIQGGLHAAPRDILVWVVNHGVEAEVKFTSLCTKLIARE
jgi:hypothetical protein